MSDFRKNKDLLSSNRRGKEKKSRMIFGEWILEKTRWQTSDDADLFSEGGSSLDQYAPFW